MWDGNFPSAELLTEKVEETPILRVTNECMGRLEKKAAANEEKQYL